MKYNEVLDLTSEEYLERVEHINTIHKQGKKTIGGARRAHTDKEGHKYTHCPYCNQEVLLGEQKRQTIVCRRCDNIFGVVVFKTTVRFRFVETKNTQKFSLTDKGKTLIDKDTGKEIITYEEYRAIPPNLWDVLKTLAQEQLMNKKWY